MDFARALDGEKHSFLSERIGSEDISLIAYRVDVRPWIYMIQKTHAKSMQYDIVLLPQGFLLTAPPVKYALFLLKP